MLAYISWHRPAAEVDPAAYERALEQFHRSLAHRPPSGFRGSAALRADELPWLGGGEDESGAGGYEDWYLLDDWSAVGVMEEAAVSHGHLGAHDKVATLAGTAASAVYRFLEGNTRLDAVRLAVWVTRTRGHENPSLAALLGDGMDPRVGGLWRRCLGLGPAPEFCLLAAETSAGVAPSRLPHGWTASTGEREVLWHG